MSSYRDAINQAVKAQLTGKTIAGDRIFTSLDRLLDPATDLPAIMVYTTTSRRGRNDLGNGLIPRLVNVVIEAAVVAGAGLEIGAAEAFADEIETAIEADRSLGLVVNDCQWQQAATDATSHGSVTMGAAIVQYEVEIFTHVKPDGAYEPGDDGFTAPPTEIQVGPLPVPVPPEWLGELNDDEFFQTTNPPLVPDPDTACGQNGCDIPAWRGERDR